MSMFATMAARFRGSEGARQGDRRGEGADRQVRKIRRPAVDPASRRHRHDPGGEDRPLFQAADHDREHLWRHRLPAAPRQRGRRAGVIHPVIPTAAVMPAKAGHPVSQRTRHHLRLPRRTGSPASSRAMTEGQAEATTMKNTPFDLTGKVAVVTGSSRGIGRSSAELLAKLGAKVVISSRKADACQEVADGIRKSGGDAHVIPCNISRHDEVEGADRGHDEALRQDRHPGLQRRGESLLRPAARHQGRGLRQDHGLERQEQHLALRARDPADGRARQRLGRHHLLDRRLARLDRDRRLRHLQGRRLRARAAASPANGARRACASIAWRRAW